VSSQTKAARSIVPALLAAVIVVLDRVSKVAIQNSLGPTESIPVVPGWLRIVHTENAGAAFGFLGDGNALLRSVVLIGISSLVMIFVAISLWGHRGEFHATASRIGLALIFGGAAGNMYDRVVRGTVTDFIEVYHGLWSFPAFNVADSAITVGGALLVIELLWPRHRISVSNQTEVVQK